MAGTTHDPRPDEALGGGHTEPPDPAAAADPDDPTDAETATAPMEAGAPGEPVDVGDTDAIVPEVPEIPGAAAEPDDTASAAGEADDQVDPAQPDVLTDVDETEAEAEAEASDEPAEVEEPPSAPDETEVESPESDTAVPADVVEPADEVEPVAATAPAFGDDDTAAPDRGHEWVDRWTDIQVGFVDDPRRTLEAADALVGEVLDEVMATFANERARLGSQWRSGSEPSTEDLRLALQRYRSFFDRLVAT